MIARLLGISRCFGSSRGTRTWGARGVAAVQAGLLALLPVAGTLAEASVCMASGTMIVRLALVDGTKVEGRLVVRAPSGYVVLVGGQERRYPYYEVVQADEWPEGTPQPVAQPEPPVAPPSRSPSPRADSPAEVPPKPPTPAPAPRAKPRAERPAPRSEDLMLDDRDPPEVPGRGLSTVGWITFGVAGGGATLFAASGEAKGAPQLEAILVLGAVSGLAMAGAGIGRRNDALQRLNKWRRARGLRELDNPPDDESQLYLPQAPQPTWAIAPAWAPGTGALVLSGTF